MENTTLDVQTQEPRKEQIQDRWDCFTAREQEVLRLLFGMDGNPPTSAEDIAERFGVTPARIHQIKTKAIRRVCGCQPLRRTKRLRDFLDDPADLPNDDV